MLSCTLAGFRQVPLIEPRACPCPLSQDPCRRVCDHLNPEPHGHISNSITTRSAMPPSIEGMSVQVHKIRRSTELTISNRTGSCSSSGPVALPLSNQTSKSVVTGGE